MSETYRIPLKHVEWVQKELEILERAGVIQRSMSPWASPIVIVPKKMEPGEPPRRRMCVDYRMLNSLLPPVNKAHSKAKGIVTLVPLPKIDEIYAYRIPRSLNPLILKPSRLRCSWIQGNGQSPPLTHMTQPPKETGSLSIDI